MALTGILLAGGTSRRMGCDKALLVVDGERLVDRALRVLGACCEDIVVTAGPSRRLDLPAGVRQVADIPGESPLSGTAPVRQVADIPGESPLSGTVPVRQVADDGEGPLSGIVAGLGVARHDLAVVLAVDLPDADPVVLGTLAAHWTGQLAVVPRAEGRLQPLHAVWSRAALEPLRERLASGQLGVIAACQALGAAVLDVGGHWHRNLNDTSMETDRTG